MIGEKHSHSIIKRDLKIDEEDQKRDFRAVDALLSTVTKRFVSDSRADSKSLEQATKEYSEMIGKVEAVEEVKSTKVMEAKSSRIISKKKEEKAIFYDIFIQPKETKIKELRQKEFENKQKKSKSVMKDKKPSNQNSNIITHTQGSEKRKNSDAVIETHTHRSGKEEEVQSHQVKAEDQIDTLNEFLSSKFIPKMRDENKKNFFNQLIQIKPPEGINAVVASPLMESKGWAPSIPSMQLSKKTNINDLMMRARGGIQAGDIPKEAHMAFYLGIMNEEAKKYDEALKFYKKYFLSAKLLQDIYGTELALNRIAVLYSNTNDFDQSLYYNEKHRDITTHNINGFVACYNCGVCQRVLGKIEESIKSFEQALQMAEEENDIESYTICLCQLAISNIFYGNMEAYFKYTDDFFRKNRTLKHAEMEMEMLMLVGYMNNVCELRDKSLDYYKEALRMAYALKNEYYQSIAVCNLGVITADKEFESFLDNLGSEI